MSSCLKEIENTLPPTIARKNVSKLLGGIVSAKTLANLDSIGKGPKRKFKIGKTVCYYTTDLLEWIENR